MPRSYARLAAILTLIAGIIGAIVSVSIPLGYWWLAERHQLNELEIEVRFYADHVTNLINANPDLWQFEQHRLQLAVEEDVIVDKNVEKRMIFDHTGELLAQNPVKLEWPVRSVSATLYDAGEPIGRMVIARSARSILNKTVMLAIISLLLGVIIFLTLRLLPLQALHKAMGDLSEQETRLRLVVDNAQDGIIMLNHNDAVEAFNPAAERLFDHSAKQALGMHIAQIIETENETLNIGNIETIGRKRTGTRFPLELGVSEAHLAGEQKKICLVRDITERKRSQEQLHQLANYDSLTGLPNRLLFHDLLQLAMRRAERKEQLLALLFLDLDNFKAVNDTLGHDVGDDLLKQMSQRLAQAVRQTDSVSRYSEEDEDQDENVNVARLGGDEFTLFLEDVHNVEDVTKVAERILATCSKPFDLQGSEVFVTPSIGIALYPVDNTDIEGLIKDADTAMYRAKQVGRNNYQFFTKEMNTQMRQRLSLETSLRHALAREEFELWYQPKLDLRDNHISGVEALLRWRNPERGLTNPADFIPMLEETGLIIPVGHWVLATACAQAVAWQQAGLPPIAMAVNLSPRQFRHKNLATEIRQILNESGLAPEYLELEITESLLMERTEVSVNTLSQLKAMGIRISMDDFGTGYSSLSYLKRFPLDTLKIDRSFISGPDVNAEDEAIMRAIIALGKNLELDVIAEGVETQEQLVLLKAQGCDLAQGYLLSKPLPAHDFARWLSENQQDAKRHSG